jgi:hypothetical protein
MHGGGITNAAGIKSKADGEWKIPARAGQALSPKTGFG